MDGEEPDEDGFDLGERDLIRSVGEGFRGILVHFHEDTIDSRGDGAAGEDWGEDAIAPGRSAESSRTLHGVGGIEDDGDPLLPHPREGTHVGDEVIVSEGSAAFGDREAFAVEVAELADNGRDVPRGEELALLDVHRASALSGGAEEVGLAAEEGGDLQEVDCFGRDFDFFRGVDVGGDGDAEFLPDLAKNAAAFLHAGATVGIDRSAVGFIVGSLEDEIDADAVGDFLERAGHAPGEVFILETTGTEDEERIAGADGDVVDLEGVHASVESS